MSDNKMQFIDTNKITADSDIVKSIINHVSKCGCKYNSRCPASNCNECIAKVFNKTYNPFSPTIDASPIKYTKKGLHVGHKYYCSACNNLSYIEDYCSKCGAKLIENKDNERYVNLIEAANYLILLFYKTDKEYSCSRTKLAKLLSIIAFKYALQDKKIFREEIYKYYDCGTNIIEIMNNYTRDIYMCFDYKDNTNPISDTLKDESSLDKNILDRYPIKSLNDEFKEIVEEVFFKFGAYSTSQLGECIVPIVNQKNIVGKDNEINLFAIKNLSLDDFRHIQSHERKLIEYLFN